MKTAKESFNEYVSTGKIVPAMISENTPLLVDEVPYYVFSEEGKHFPQSRILAMQDIVSESDEYGMTGLELTEYLQQMRAFAQEAMECTKTNPNRANQVNRLIQAITETMKLRTEMKGGAVDKMVDVSAMWFIAENEDPGYPHQSVQRAKTASLAGDTRNMTFYLQWGKSLANPIIGGIMDAGTLKNLMRQSREVMKQELLMVQMVGHYLSTLDKKENQGNFWELQEAILLNMIESFDDLLAEPVM